MDRSNPVEVGQEIYQLITRLYPICRSITGDGLRETLRILREEIDLEIHEVPSGTKVFDWEIPNEWNIRDAYIMNSKGERVVDFRKSNLHVVNYSIPIKQKMRLDQLREHLFTLSEHPNWIPYRTTYYKETWGFCLSQAQLEGLEEGEYEVVIDSTLTDGHMTYGEYYLPGECPEEILISCHACHPSLCNDNLSGVGVATYFAKWLSSRSTQYSYRFLFIPATIGAIAWLASNEAHVSKIKHGLVLACVGDSGDPTYKRSRRGGDEIDRAVEHVLKHSDGDFEIIDFFPYGYDERQYCSPGFNMPIGSFMRTPHGQFPEYHTSADNLDFVQPQFLGDTFAKLVAIIEVLEENKKFLNRNPKGEPQLGRRGLYEKMGRSDVDIDLLAVLWILNLSDGEHSLLDIAERADMEFGKIQRTAQVLLEHHLLQELAS